MSQPTKNCNHFFPEDLFPPVSKDYSEKLSNGLQIASGLNLIILGAIRDSQDQLIRNFKCVEHIGSYFKSWQSFWFENDSSDKTPEFLNKIKKPGYIIVKNERWGTRKLADRSLERRKNMARARNEYLSYLRKIQLGSNYICIVLDIDLKGGYSYTGLLNSLSFLKEDTCIGSNSLIYQDSQRLFYDTWAFKDSQERTEEEKNLMVFHRGELPFEVDSCFGGLMIYPARALLENIWYEDWDCDHVTLHKQLKDKGYKIMLNPSQITLYNEHYYV